MKLLFCQPAARGNDVWLQDLRAALPGVQLDEWQPGLPPVYDAAVVWGPPQQMVDEQPQLKALLNLGAGVDKLLALRLPPGMAVVRLEDAGMAVQMAEYVCHALIRFFREFGAYERQQKEGLWHPRRPHARADFPVGVMGLGALARAWRRRCSNSNFLCWAGAAHRAICPACSAFMATEVCPGFCKPRACWSACCR